jgi:hypothetical protein
MIQEFAVYMAAIYSLYILCWGDTIGPARVVEVPIHFQSINKRLSKFVLGPHLLIFSLGLGDCVFLYLLEFYVLLVIIVIHGRVIFIRHFSIKKDT